MKSDAVLEARGFDMAHAGRLFPGYVLEQESTRWDYGERRLKTIGELMGDVLVVIYTVRDGAWEADHLDTELWHERYP